MDDGSARANGLPERVRSALATASSDAAARLRAAASLEILLEGVRCSTWTEVSWQFSRLTAGGFPLEFVWASHDARVRYTVEVAGPEFDAARRLDRALDLLARLGATPPSREAVDALRAIQAGGELRYGAWLGGRHDPRADRYKLYVEIPEPMGAATQAWARRVLGDWPYLAERRMSLRMVGIEVESGASELYFRVDGLERWEVASLLRRFGWADRAPLLRGVASELCGERGDAALAGSKLGFSFAIAEDGGLEAFSIFAFASSILGNEDRIRSALSGLGERRGWDMSSYARLADPPAASCRPRHGMLAIGIGRRAEPWLQVGIAP